MIVVKHNTFPKTFGHNLEINVKVTCKGFFQTQSWKLKYLGSIYLIRCWHFIYIYKIPGREVKQQIHAKSLSY